MTAPTQPPLWVTEFERHCRTRRQIFVYGNVRDLVYLPVPIGADGKEEWAAFTMEEALLRILAQRIGSYEVVGHYDIVDGIVYADEIIEELTDEHHSSRERRSMAALFAESEKAACSSRRTGDGRPAPVRHGDVLNSAIGSMRAVLGCANDEARHSCALIVDYASQLVAQPTGLQATERHAFLQLLKSAQESQFVGFGASGRQNLLVVVCGALNELPTWAYMDNPFAASVHVGEPTLKERENFFRRTVPVLDAVETAALTDGMSTQDLLTIASLAEEAATEDEPAGRTSLLPKAVVDHYKYGDRASLWSEIPWGDLSEAEMRLEQRVFGQPAAVYHVADVLRRARLHLSGAQHSGRGKPRGVLFFAGPTGVGKTELAKAIAELLFGDEEHCLRFDMSEYMQPHSDQRLIGAPPGYVGYDAGGQLTNAVRENPFSVLLFDEIEKADGSILDKFLQILEDGRMTDGRGDTVYFSECIIIFTSNAGLYRTDKDGQRVLRIPDPVALSFTEVREEILRGVEEYFITELRRPELLNRFGENIVVFDFVRIENLRRVLAKAVEGVRQRINERWGIHVDIAPDVTNQLEILGQLDVGRGARGVGNKVEQMLLNPLARWLFAQIPAKAAVTAESRSEDSASSRSGGVPSDKRADEEPATLDDRRIRNLLQDSTLRVTAVRSVPLDGDPKATPSIYEVDAEWVS